MKQAMEIKIIEESGYLSALQGMMFSFQLECPLDEIPELDVENAEKIARKLSHKNKGHNKFLEHIHVDFIVRAGLDWWKHFDTYRIGMSKLSKSTMHTLKKKPLNAEDFDCDVHPAIIEVAEMIRQGGDLRKTSKNLPQGFFQTRKMSTNYKVIKGIIEQRLSHRLIDWEFFINYMMNNLEHPELIFKQ